MMAFLAEVNGVLEENDAANPVVGPLEVSLGHLRQATLWFMQNAMAKPDNAGAGSTDYMHLFGLVALGYMWARMAKAALAKPDERQAKIKLVTARFFAEKLLPETATRLARITAGADSVMALAQEDF
jgi:acyl-CoA dehydrogenase